MSGYKDEVRKHRRLAILKLLAGVDQYTLNASLLEDGLNGVGVPSTRSQVITEVVWLSDNGFANHQDHGDFVVVTATDSGVNISSGRSTHPEIKRPRAGS